VDNSGRGSEHRARVVVVTERDPDRDERADVLERVVAAHDAELSEVRGTTAGQTRLLTALRQTQLEQSRTLQDLSHAVGVLLVAQDGFQERLDEHDERFDGVERRLDGIDGRLDSHTTLLQEIATTVRDLAAREG
jgi:chromosome segregation ATPase